MNKSGKTVREEAGMMAAAVMIIMCASRKKKAHEKKSFTVEGFPSNAPPAHTCAHALSDRARANSELVLPVSPDLEGGWLAAEFIKIKSANKAAGHFIL